ncbi:MAG TPA: universal stress protein [Silvibacterium sp.]|jgi:nucleotide-binding universal stress UspA family protein|nr:universal stress protein [Silvibacterium sp.]
MFRRIVVAYNESPESQRALESGVQLAKSLNAELQTVTVRADLPAYTAYAAALDASTLETLEADHLTAYESLQLRARSLAESHGIELSCHLIDGGPVDSIADFLRKHKVDLLVIGLHQRTSHLARMWSTVYELAQEAPCSVLGVH